MKASELTLLPDFEGWSATIYPDTTAEVDPLGNGLLLTQNTTEGASFYRSPDDPPGNEAIDGTDDSIVFRVLNPRGDSWGALEVRGGVDFEGLALYWGVPSGGDLAISAYWPEGGSVGPYEPGGSYRKEIWVRVTESGGSVVIEIADDISESWSTIGSFPTPADWNSLDVSFSVFNASVVGSKTIAAFNPALFSPTWPKIGDLPGIEFTEIPPEASDDSGWQFFQDAVTLDDDGVVIPTDGYAELYNTGPLDFTETSTVWHLLAPAPSEISFFIQQHGAANRQFLSTGLDPEDGKILVYTDGVRSDYSFTWLGTEKWLRYTESAGVTTWEAASVSHDWHTLASFPSPLMTNVNIVDFGFYAGSSGDGVHLYSFNVPDPTVVITLDTTPPGVTFGDPSGTNAGDFFSIPFTLDPVETITARLRLADGSLLTLEVDGDTLGVLLPPDTVDGFATVEVLDDVGNAATTTVAISGVIPVSTPAETPSPGFPRQPRPRTRSARSRVSVRTSFRIHETLGHTARSRLGIRSSSTVERRDPAPTPPPPAPSPRPAPKLVKIATRISVATSFTSSQPGQVAITSSTHLRSRYAIDRDDGGEVARLVALGII